jgi:uncharacterized damage-inducible protein DinB
MSVPFPSPTTPAGSRAEVFLRYLAYFRDRLEAKLRALPDGDLRVSRLPSGWTPLELLKHLTYVESRWLEWGFEGRAVPDPWGDRRQDRWYVGPDETLDDLAAKLAEQAQRSTEIISGHDLSEVGQPGERWGGDPPATLERILFHLVQEYARHLGHLDIVAELAGGQAGELRPRCHACPCHTGGGLSRLTSMRLGIPGKRAAACVLAASAAFVGLWAEPAPRSFYDSFPFAGHHWVAALGPYNVHLTRDVGGLYLALFVMSGWAAVRPRAETFAVIGAGWLAFSLPHLAFHVFHLDGFGTADKIGNVIALGAVAVLAALLLVPAGQTIGEAEVE